jgi:hypothetical protein
MRLRHVATGLAGVGILLSITAMGIPHHPEPGTFSCEQPAAAPASPSPSATPSPTATPSPSATSSPSATPSPSPTADETASASPSVTPSSQDPTPSSSALAAAPPSPSLCLGVTPLAGSAQRGKPALFTVQIWAENWPQGKVTVLLSGQAAMFTVGCPSGDKSASCTISALSATPVKLQAQLTVKLGVRTVMMTATARTTAITLPHPLMFTDTLKVAEPAAPKPSAPATQVSLPPIPLPSLTTASSSVISPGSASGLFPAITPSPSPSTTPDPTPAAPTQPAPRSTAAPKADPPGLLPLGSTLLTAQAIGLVALAAAIVLAVTRRRHTR